MECDCKNYLKADSYSLFELGVRERGSFTHEGVATGWHLDMNLLDEELPIFLKEQPVLQLYNNKIYIRGLYSKELSKERWEVMRGYDLPTRTESI